MTKFVSADDPGFVAVFKELRRWIRDMAAVETLRHAASDRSRAEQQSSDDQQQRAKVSMVFRIRGVPLGWDVHQLKSFLAQQEELQPRGGSVGPVISSLAGDIHGRSRVATATFSDLPPAFRVGTLWSTNLPSLPDQPSLFGQPARLTLDNHFHGITTLYSPAPEDHKIE